MNKFPVKYKCLNNNRFILENYEIIPIRFEDRLLIMKWRNEQIFHLRQNKPLTENSQDDYFNNIIREIFDLEKPNQILFSFLFKGNCIGYGGLVHINWVDKNAEISFIMDTNLESKNFISNWKIFLQLIERVGFDDLAFHKIFTYAFDVRPKLYEALSSAKFTHEATLKDHCYFERQFKDVLIHSKINKYVLRRAMESDLSVTFEWASDKYIRKYSFNKSEITYEGHRKWFISKINSSNCYYYILENSLHTNLGSIRIDINDNKEGIISYLIDSNYQGKGLGIEIIRLLEKEIQKSGIQIDKLIGFVDGNNIASKKIFRRMKYLEFQLNEEVKFEKVLLCK